jgi:adenosine kinase
MSIVKGNTHYIGSVGDDDNGKLLASVALKAGVQTHYFVSKKHHTGRCAVVVKDRERSLVADLAAANDYSHDHFLSNEIQDLVKSAHIFYSAGFFLTVSPQTIVEVGKHVLANENKVLAINLAAGFIINFFWDALNSVLPYADFVIGNEDEAAAFAEKAGWPKGDLSACAISLSKLPKQSSRSRTVIFTQGKDPTIVAVNGEATLYPVAPIDKSLIVDTNGAGDSFVAGFLAGLAENKPLAVCVAAGHYCACKVIQVEGAQFPSTPNKFKW